MRNSVYKLFIEYIYISIYIYYRFMVRFPIGMDFLFITLAMSLGLMCVLSLKVMELLACFRGRLWASPCIVFQ